MQRYDKFRLPPNFSGKKLHFYVIFSHFLTKHTKNSGLRCFFTGKREGKGVNRGECIRSKSYRDNNRKSSPIYNKEYARMADRRAVMPRSRGRNPGVPSDDRVPNATSRQRLLCEIIHALTLPHARRRQSQIGSPSWRPETLRVSPMLRIPPFAHGAREPADTPLHTYRQPKRHV